MRYRSDMSKDEIDKTRDRILKLVYSVKHETPRSTDKMSWSPFELSSETLELVGQVKEYSSRMARLLETKGATDLEETIHQFVSSNPNSAKAVLFHLLKLSFQIRGEHDENSQKMIIEYAVCLQIFEEALQDLKIDAEAGYEKAAYALQEVQELISAQMCREGCDLDLIFDVINALNDVKIEIIEPIKTAMLRLGETEEMEEYHADLPTLEKMIDSLLKDGKNIYEVYDILVSPSRAMPLDGRFEFVNSLAQVSGSTGRDLLILTCLDREVDIRRHAIHTLQKRKIKDFDGRSLRQLYCLSMWMPDETCRSMLTVLVRKLMMSGLEIPADIEMPKAKIIATAIDGSGCQVLFGAIPNGSASQTFGIMFKQREGVEDAWISNHLSVEEFKNAVEHSELMPEQYEIDLEYLRVSIPYFLCRSIESNQPVPQGLLALTELLPLEMFKPGLSGYEEKTARMRKLLKREDFNNERLQSGFLNLYDRCYFHMWFEEGSEVESIVTSSDDTDEVRRELRRRVIDPNLAKWHEKLTLMSVLLFLARKNSGRRWQDFYYVVNRIEEGCASTKDQVFDAISRCSHMQMIERMKQ